MPRLLTLALFLFLLVDIVSPAQQNETPASSAKVSTLSTGTQLVVVDVIVEDRDGRPVDGLKASDFDLVENRTPQTIKSFDPHSATESADRRMPPIPTLPPGTFTGYTPVTDRGALNVLLLDSLNTPARDQAYVRAQLRQYIRTANPGARIAIFGLNRHLILLQGFTSSPAILKSAVGQKLPLRQSTVLSNPSGVQASTTNLSDQMADIGADNDVPSFEAALTVAVANLRQMEVVNESYETALRTRYTLDAFNQLAHYLSSFPGRKNLIWFSGSFPISVLPDATITNPFDVMKDNGEELRETTNMLARARVAVYPVDVHEMPNSVVFSGANTGMSSSREPRPETPAPPTPGAPAH